MIRARRHGRRRPLIAVTAPVKDEPESGIRSVVLEEGYETGVQVAEAVPLVISPALEPETVEFFVGMMDGLVLSGGEDVDPDRYGEDPLEGTSFSRERDELEWDLAERALERGVPVLAICRGMQLLNVLLGGSLYQDLSAQRRSAVDHDRSGEDARRPVHGIRVERSSLLEGVFEDPTFRINSSHHQGVRELGAGLEPVAWAEDGLVEAVEYRADGADGWVVGVQWHPERMLAERTGAHRRLFERFGRAVRRRSGGPA